MNWVRFGRAGLQNQAVRRRTHSESSWTLGSRVEGAARVESGR